MRYQTIVKETLMEQKKMFSTVIDRIRTARKDQRKRIPHKDFGEFDGLAEVHTVHEENNEMILSLTPKYKDYKELWVDVEKNRMVVRTYTKTGQKGKKLGSKKLKNKATVLRDIYTEELEELLKDTINYKLEDF